ncbi:MAG TPA: flavodoxin-dependent (E)-4-hydroxy-3-methylbut-2-enyl-diphosphate synthase [bacterium]|nr:flavodoxin-dependent (E)-4-hydroxy-3-methylbut-2-enyl-diphosphate synthase [bacterium]
MEKKTRAVKIGGVKIGAGFPVAVQSMTNTRTSDVKSTLAQIKRLEECGCEIVRCSVPDMDSAAAVLKIKRKIKIPLTADIHYDYRLAIEAIKNGADKIRINPGNIGSAEKVRLVVEAAKKARVPVRIGVNAGSLKPKTTYRLKASSGDKTADKMVQNLLEYIEFFEWLDFTDIVVSLKASDVPVTIMAHRLYSRLKDYPVHIGITEAGTELSGTIKSSVGLGILLNEGIGDTMRVSLTAEPEKEVYTAYRILDTLGIRKRGVEIISCPTCARTEVDVIRLAGQVEKMTINTAAVLKVAVMGCSVNGIGEAGHADIGVCGGKKIGIIFKSGKIVKKAAKKELLKYFDREIKKLIREKGK